MVVNFNQLLVDQKSGPRFNIVGFRIILAILKRGTKIVAIPKGWLAIAKLKPLSLFISLLSMIKKAFYNVEIAK